MKYTTRLYHSCRCFDQNLVRQSFIIRTFATNGSVKDYVREPVPVRIKYAKLVEYHTRSLAECIASIVFVLWNTVEQRICVLNPLIYNMGLVKRIARRRHDLEPISASLILCERSPQVIGGFPSQMAKYRVVLMGFFIFLSFSCLRSQL